MRRCRETSVKRLLRVNADKNEKLHGKHRGGRGDWVSPRVGNYSKPRVLKERSDFNMEFNMYEEVPGNISQEIVEGKRR